MNTSQKAHLDALTKQTYSPVTNDEFVYIGDSAFMGLVALAVFGLLVMLVGFAATIKGAVAGLAVYAALNIVVSSIMTVLMDSYKVLNK